jgi:uncharacterized integral membrane protein
MGLARGIIFFFLLVLGIGFAILNDGPVSLKYYLGLQTPPLPLFLWALLFLLLGLILSGLWSFFSKIGLHSRIRYTQRTIASLERERNRLAEERRNP